ncbi:type III pantothenate kinase [bacterium]|nr:type III pantothenate kinase [bacterium]
MGRSCAWLLDFGNSRLKVLHTEDEAPFRIAAIPRETVERGDELFISQFLSACSGRTPASHVVAALGRPGDEQLLAPLVARLAPGATLVLVTPESLAPGRVLYTSGRPGADRLANVLALKEKAPGCWSVAVDFGTATHLTVADPDGNLAGGAILPGIRMLARALSRETGGRLPEIDPFKAVQSPAALGNSTQGALEAGVLLGHAGAVERLLSDIEREVGDPLGAVFATGGAATKVLPLLRREGIAPAPTLTMDGLRSLFAKMG